MTRRPQCAGSPATPMVWKGGFQVVDVELTSESTKAEPLSFMGGAGETK